MEYLKDLHETCEMLSRELREANEKIKRTGGKLSAGDLDYIDKLTHALKSVKTTIAMMEADEDGESGYMPYGVRGGNSYARRRDSMGRYTSRRGGMSYDDGMVDEIRDLMERAPDEHTKREFGRIIDRLERM